MNTYSRALRHIDIKDVKQKHQQKIIEQKIQEEKKKEEEKYIASLMEKKKYNWRKKLLEDGIKYLEEEPTMSSSGMFQTTLPATGNLQYTISGETVDVVSGGFNITFDSSNIDTFVFIVSLPAGRTATVSSGSNSRTVSSSGTYELSVSQSKTLTVQFRFSAGDGTPSVPDIHGKRLTPINVFVSLDSPEAAAFIRTDPILSNLSPQEKRKRLEDMLDAGDEYLLKQLGIQGSTARPADTGNIRSWEQAAQEANEVAQQKYQQDLAAYEKAIAADKQKSEELSKAVDAARAEYLKSGQSVAQRQQSYNKLQAAIKAGTDHALSTLRNPIIKPTPPTPPASQPQPKFTSKQLADIDKQIKDLQAQSEKNKQDAQNTRWKAAGQLAGEIALGAAGLAGAGVGLAAGVRAIQTARTVSQVRKATRVYNTYKALEKIKDAAATKRMTSSGKYTAKPNPNRTPVKGGGMYKDSYEPQGQVISEKKLKSPQEVLDKIPGYYDGKPAPLGFPETPPPKTINGYHPDLVDGKKVADRFNRLDPISAKAMPLTGNPHIDKKVKAARKKPK